MIEVAVMSAAAGMALTVVGVLLRSWQVLTYACSCLLLAGLFGVPAVWREGIRAGCIGATNGHPAWVLTTQPDGSVQWVEKEAKQ